MNENFPKQILTFLGGIYFLGCVGEVVMVKDGAALVFQSVEKLVPHMAMFILGFYFSRK
jgi:hypothetical protein